MGGNSLSSLRSLTCYEVASSVNSFGKAYELYFSVIIENGINGEVLVEYAAMDDINLKAVFSELHVTPVTHQIRLRKEIRTFSSSSSSRLHEIFDDKRYDDVDNVVRWELPKDKLYHVFLTYAWGEEPQYFNHQRVSKINDILKSEFELKTFFDKDRITGSIRETLRVGLENSMILVVFITKRYAEKVNKPGGDLRSSCKVNWLLTYSNSFFFLFCALIHSGNLSLV
jgi:hypothetical protein